MFSIDEADAGFLLASMKRGDALLVLGAGASATSLNQGGEPVAQSRTLAKLLATAAGQPYSNESLWEVLSAIRGEYLSDQQISKILAEQYSNVSPSEELTALLGYTWRRLYTWNIDDGVENVHRAAQRRKYFNGQIDKAREFESSDVLHCIKLHGDIGKPEHGFVLTEEEYNRIVIADGHDWYKRAASDYITNVPIFIGSRLNEPILSAELDRARKSPGEGLGRAFLITPDEFTILQLKALQAKKIVVIKATLADFVDWLSAKLPQGVTPIQAAASANEFSGRVSGQLSISANDLETARSIFPIKYDRLRVINQSQSPLEHERSARQFLMGMPPNWAIGASDIPVWLKDTARLERALRDAIERRDRIFVVTGQSGSGKTTATLQVLVRLLQDAPETVLYDLRPDLRSLRTALQLLERLHPNEHVLAYIGDAFLYGDSLSEDLTSIPQGRVTLVAGARTGEWNEHLERHLGELCEPFAFQRFSATDYEPLIERLVRYVPAPKFKKASQKDRIERMKRSDSQLLIALREATESESFAEVIAREYEDLSTDGARAIVLLTGIATIARVGISQAVAREAFQRLVKGASFDETVRSLEGIVTPGSNGRLFARHEVYVRHIVDNVADFDLLLDVVIELLRTFTKYDAPIVKSVNREDMLLFKFVINHNFLKETFAKKGRVHDGLEVYRQFEVGFQLDGHFWLQYGQYLKEVGQYEQALTMLKRSTTAYTNNPYAFHAYAEVQLIVARRRKLYDATTTSLIDDAVTTLLKQDAVADTTWDQYPIVTLAYEHVGALVAHKRPDLARKAASQYFDRIQQLEKRSGANTLQRAKGLLMTYLTFGEWSPPSRFHRGRRYRPSHDRRPTR